MFLLPSPFRRLKPPLLFRSHQHLVALYYFALALIALLSVTALFYEHEYHHRHTNGDGGAALARGDEGDSTQPCANERGGRRRVLPSAAFYAHLLPHLTTTSGDIEPIVLLRNTRVFRSPPPLLIAIPSTHRRDANYLPATLASLLGDNLRAEERRLVQFVVLIGRQRSYFFAYSLALIYAFTVAICPLVWRKI